jgi:hypothetical protein
MLVAFSDVGDAIKRSMCRASIFWRLLYCRIDGTDLLEIPGIDHKKTFRGIRHCETACRVSRLPAPALQDLTARVFGLFHPPVNPNIAVAPSQFL